MNLQETSYTVGSHNLALNSECKLLFINITEEHGGSLKMGTTYDNAVP